MTTRPRPAACRSRPAAPARRRRSRRRKKATRPGRASTCPTLDGRRRLLPDLLGVERAAGQGDRRGGRGQAARARRASRGTSRAARAGAGCCSTTWTSSCTSSTRRRASTTCSNGCGATPGAWTLVWNELKAGLAAALEAAGLATPERLARVDLADPARDASHGDWTTNFCMLIAKEAGRPPRGARRGDRAALPARGRHRRRGRGGGPGVPQLPLSRRVRSPRCPRASCPRARAFGRSDVRRRRDGSWSST